MARTPITRTALPVAGLNLTDASFSTLATGAGNGVEVPYRVGDVLFLRNSTGGNAVFTIKVAQPAAYSALGITVPDETFTVVTAKTHAIPLSVIFRQADGDIYIDCDVAGNVLMLAMS